MSTRHAAGPAVLEDDRVRALETIPFDTQSIVDVQRPSDLDAVGRSLAHAHMDGLISRAEAEMLLLYAIPGTGILGHELVKKGAQQLRLEVGPVVEQRLQEKIDAGKSLPASRRCVDIDRFASASAAAWARQMISALIFDALRRHRDSTGRLLFNMSIDDEDESLAVEGALARQSTAEESELERQRSALHEVERTLYDDGGKRRRVTESAKIHVTARFLYQVGEWPHVTVPLTWREREEVRRLLEDEAAGSVAGPGETLKVVLAARSLSEFDPHIPVALSSMWDGYDEETRALLARNARAAHMLALAATTPFPRPRRSDAFGRFSRAVAGLSDDVRWRSVARKVSDAFVAVFVDTRTAQGRASAETMAKREAKAAEGRERWDELMLSHRMPRAVEPVAATGSDLVEVLVGVWHRAVSEAEDSYERSAA